MRDKHVIVRRNGRVVEISAEVYRWRRRRISRHRKEIRKKACIKMAVDLWGIEQVENYLSTIRDRRYKITLAEHLKRGNLDCFERHFKEVYQMEPGTSDKTKD